MQNTATVTKRPLKEIVQLIAAMPEGLQKEQAVELAWKKYGEVSHAKRFKAYRRKPAEYIKTFLKWCAWTGMDDEHPGQLQILEACAHVMLQQEEKDKFEKGELTLEELTAYKPGQPIKNWIRVESGNGIGKTKSASGILNWFLDCFTPSAIFTFAPGGEQARFVLWATIRGDREGKGLPGRILEKEIKITARHFAAHRTVSEGLGKGEERLKGKHEAFQLFILDEADGISQTVFDAITAMTSGGNSLILMFANPKSRASMFHRIKNRSFVQTFRVSTLYHPNVLAGWEVIPGAVKRKFVEDALETDCEILHIHRDENCDKSDKEHTQIHNEDDFTFELPYEVTVAGITYEPGTIFKPNARFMTNILGETPPASTDKTVIPVGRYAAACLRKPIGEGDPTKIRVGVDAARSGSDTGTIYIKWRDKIWRAAQILQGDTNEYWDAIRKPLFEIYHEIQDEFPEHIAKSLSLHIRIDAAYGSGVIDKLKGDMELIEAFSNYQVLEVWFQGSAHSTDYDDIATEMYYQTAESLKTLCVASPSENLEIDLCEREFEWVNRSGIDKKKLEQKKKFKEKKGHSPDDGDAFVLAAAPDFIFSPDLFVSPLSLPKTSLWGSV